VTKSEEGPGFDSIQLVASSLPGYEAIQLASICTFPTNIPYPSQAYLTPQKHLTDSFFAVASPHHLAAHVEGGFMTFQL